MKIDFGSLFIKDETIYRLVHGKGIRSKFALDIISEPNLNEDGYFIWEMKSNHLIPVTRNELLGKYRKMTDKECAKFLLAQENYG